MVDKARAESMACPRPRAMLNWAVTKFNTCPTQVQEAEESRQPDITAIVVSWNVCDLLVRCIEALRSPSVTGGCSVEVIVVDNASTDGSAEVMASVAGTKLIRTGRNLGYGRANNLGLKSAAGRYLLILNPDAILQPGALPALLTFAERRQRAGIVAPRLLNQDGSVQAGAFRFPSLTMAAIDLFPLPHWMPGRVRSQLSKSALNGRYVIEQEANNPFRIDHPLGACMLLRREAYTQCGGFDPQIFMYSEEIDLALRYRQAGWECWQVPAARAVHLGGASTKQLPGEMMLELWRSRLYFYRKHRSSPAYVALSLLLITAQVGKMSAVCVGRLLGRIDAPQAMQRIRQARDLSKLVLAR